MSSYTQFWHAKSVLSARFYPSIREELKEQRRRTRLFCPGWYYPDLRHDGLVLHVRVFFTDRRIFTARER
jgi:hypothetical protein